MGGRKRGYPKKKSSCTVILYTKSQAYNDVVTKREGTSKTRVTKKRNKGVKKKVMCM